MPAGGVVAGGVVVVELCVGAVLLVGGAVDAGLVAPDVELVAAPPVQPRAKRTAVPKKSSLRTFDSLFLSLSKVL